MPRRTIWVCYFVVLWAGATAAAQDDPLASWNEGAAKRAIVDFVRETTDKDSPRFVPPAERIAAFDNDGTLWVEQPLYTQVVFAIDRVKALAPKHPEWKTRQPFSALLTGDDASLANFSIQDFAKIVAETHTGITTGEFEIVVRNWLKSARHPRFNRPYTELAYQPMLELLAYLRSAGYKTYIVTGGGQDFVRVFAEAVYGVPPEQVIGSAGKTKYGLRDGRPVLIKIPEVFLIDDRAGKPEGIHLLIGRPPRAAFGNSTGDQQMLEYTGGGPGARLMMLVYHDDAKREYAYGPNSKIGTFSDALMQEAGKRGWLVISMKNDWNRIFAFEPKSP